MMQGIRRQTTGIRDQGARLCPCRDSEKADSEGPHPKSHPGADACRKTLVLGLGNVIMGDEGVGVHVVRALEQESVPAGVECLDGGTGGFVLLEPLQQANRIILIDATADGNPIGTVTRTTPKFSKDYPPTLTAHDIGVKDLLDAFYIQGGSRDVILYAITIDPRQAISMELSEECERARDAVVQCVLTELRIPISEPTANVLS